jgi:drug/metabolite transporter (DMT)-like permease
MKPKDLLMLVALGALWGASYLFIRVGGHEFGAWALGGLRATGAALCLLPLLAIDGRWRELLVNWKTIAVAGLAGAAGPFVLFGYATQGISTGLTATMSAATPLYAAAIAWFWLRERMTASCVAGLVIGVAGVAWLVWDRIGLQAGADASTAGLAMAAALAATLGYGFTGNFTKRHLSHVSPIVITAGGQLFSALVLAPPMMHAWPTQTPSIQAWAALAVLTIACTALAYAMFFRLIASIGAPRTSTVSFLIPVFGVLWGSLFLGEVITAGMALGCAVVLVATALTTGLWDRIVSRHRAKQCEHPAALSVAD